MKVRGLVIILFLSILASLGYLFSLFSQSPTVLAVKTEESYWLLLQRKSSMEYLYFGTPGDENNSSLKRTFQVKTGIVGERPTPLPQLVGRKYWNIVAKMETNDNPETAPYFLTLDIPVSDEAPFGPTPYLECNGQCNWELPGSFGLHGVNGDMSRLSKEDPGSSGCIRHKDEDISYLYSLLTPEKKAVRYYIKDI